MKATALVLVAFSLQLFGSGTSTETNRSIAIDNDAWWGPGERSGVEDCSIRPFDITWDKKEIKELRKRIRSHRKIPAPLEGVAFQYGFNTANIDDWLAYWDSGYDFKKREKLMTMFPSYKTNIQGLDIYFIRVTPKVPKGVEIVPMLMIHGCPGSVLEYREAIPLLTAVDSKRDFAVELIIPSIPGFGYSDGAVRPGCGVSEVAVIFNKLMERIGHEKYYVQGGDLGGIIGQYMATMFPENVLGYHSNFLIAMTPKAAYMQLLGSVYKSLIVEDKAANRVYPLVPTLSNIMEETGYFHEHSARPDTLGVGMADSPALLLAYILEKFTVWTKSSNKYLVDGGLSELDKDWLIDNLMMYWMPSAATSAMRFYAETFNMKQFSTLRINEIPVQVPVWAIHAQSEILYQSPLIQKTKFPLLLNATTIDVGGHYLAWQEPEIFSQDVLLAVQAFRNWHNGIGEVYRMERTEDWSWIPAVIQLFEGTHVESWFPEALLHNTLSALRTIFTPQ